MSVSRENLVGSLIEGRYLIEGGLGAGGFGAVYLARDLKVLGRNVVVKVLLEESYQNEYVVKKFRQEAEALSRLDHPNVVTIYDYGELEGGYPYLVLQFIDGASLRTVIRQGGIELERAANIIRQASNALTAAHDKGILHRDLKPENIMLQTLGGEERAVVIDFGIAQVQDSVISPKTIVTAAVGTVAYMSPEQLTAGDLSPACDTYALGVIAYEIVTGQKPYVPKSPFQLLEMQRAGVSVPPRQLRPELPEAAEAVILRALSFDAGARQRRTCDFGADFYRAVTGAAGGGVGATDAAASHATVIDIAPAGDPSLLRSAAYAGSEHAPTRPYTPAAPAEHEEAREPAPPEARASGRGLKALAVAAVLLLLVGAAGVAGYLAWRARQAGPPPAVRAGAAAPAETVPPRGGETKAEAVRPELVLNYSLTVQRMREGKEYKEPFESTGREIFENGWRFRMNLSTPKPGYLYLVNEGLDEAGKTTYTVLFPTGADAHIASEQRVQIPEEPHYYFFTGEPGTEKIWVVWSERPVPEMEALKGLVNQKDQGEVSDPAQATGLREFFSRHGSPRPEAVEDKANKRTTVKAAGDMLVHLAELEHH